MIRELTTLQRSPDFFYMVFIIKNTDFEQNIDPTVQTPYLVATTLLDEFSSTSVPEAGRGVGIRSTECRVSV